MKDLEGIRVLVVEDSVELCRLYDLLLRHKGVEVTVARTKTEAHEALASSPFDLLICDLELPDGSGVDLLGAVRAGGLRTFAWIPAIAVTGLPRSPEHDRARRVGFHSIVEKPFHVKDLLQHLRAALVPPLRPEAI